MAILYLENNIEISGFFLKLFQAHDLDFHHIDNLDNLEPQLRKAHDQNHIIFSNAICDNVDMFSYTAYLKRKFKLILPIIIYTDQNIVKYAIRAKKYAIKHFLVLPALPFDIIYTINDATASIGIKLPPANKAKEIQINNQNKERINQNIDSLFKEYYDQYHIKHIDIKPACGLYDRIMQDIEPQIILSSLQYTNGNRHKAADILGINRNTLRKKMMQYDIHFINMLA
ncbi:MAG: DNA-binding protein Fis [Alphaproteobacteria bacterium]|jgi:DNA-binding protein Fis